MAAQFCVFLPFICLFLATFAMRRVQPKDVEVFVFFMFLQITQRKTTESTQSNELRASSYTGAIPVPRIFQNSPKSCQQKCQSVFFVRSNDKVYTKFIDYKMYDAFFIFFFGRLKINCLKIFEKCQARSEVRSED